jgi:hypothetical protein
MLLRRYIAEEQTDTLHAAAAVIYAHVLSTLQACVGLHHYYATHSN